MKSARSSETLGLLALALVASPYAVAADPGWYGGFNVGRSKAHLDEAGIATRLQGPALATTSISSDDRDTGYKLFGGYQFNRNFALEGGYFDLGEFSFSTTTVPAGTLNGNFEVKGWNLDLVGILPITDKFSAFGRVGAQYARTRDSFTRTGAVPVLVNPNPSERDPNYKYGLGVEYDFNQFVGLRAEAERYRINNAVTGKDNIDLFSVGLVFRFGGKTPAPVPRAEPTPTPAPVAAPPPPAPKAPPPPPQEVVTPPPPPPPPVQQQAPRRDRN